VGQASDIAGTDGWAGVAERRWRRTVAAILLVTFAAYLPCAANGYVWDDVPLIVLSDRFEAPFSLLRIFSEDLWAGAAIGEAEASGYYRPLMVLGLWADHWLGAGAGGAHVHSLVWHVAAVGVCGWLGHRIGGPRAAWMGALVLALHPLQTEAVLWVAARNDLMAATLGMAALGMALGPLTIGNAVSAGVLALLAGLSKESVLLLPVLLVVMAWVTLPGPRDRDWWTDVGRRALPLFLGILVVVALRAWAGVDSARGPTALGWRLVAAEMPRLLGLLAAKVLVPWPLSTGYALEYVDRLSVPWLLGGGLGTLALLVGLVWRGGARAIAGLCWSVVCAAPAIWAVATTGWVGERYLYLSFVGLGWALAAALDDRRHRLLLGVLLLLVGSTSAVLRTSDWRTDRTLWTSAWQASPSPFTAVSLGHAARTEGEDSEALEWFIRGLDDPEPTESACEPMMGTALGSRKMMLAAQLGHWAAAQGCRSPAFRGRFAIALASTAQWQAVEGVVDGEEDAAGRILVARAALAQARSDDAAYQRIAAEWSGEQPLDEQVHAIFDNASRFAPARSDTVTLPDGGGP